MQDGWLQRCAKDVCRALDSSNAAKAVAYQSGDLDVLRPRSQGPGRDLWLCNLLGNVPRLSCDGS